MTRLEWGQNPRLYDHGLDHGVLYLEDTVVSWNGLISVDEQTSGTMDTDHYFDGNRMHLSQETGDFEARILAYTYPDIFAEYNGYSDLKTYKRFGFSYRTEQGDDDAQQLHLVYSVLVRDDSRAWSTLSENTDPSLFNWDIYSSDVPISGGSPAAHLIMEAPRDASVFTDLEDILYGTDITEPRLPSPDEVIELYESATIMRVRYLGDGTYLVTGPDDMVMDHGDGTFDIQSPSLYLIDSDTFTVSSY